MATIKCTKCGTKIENVTSGVIECPNCKHKMKYVPKKSNINIQSGKVTPKSNNKKLKDGVNKKENNKNNNKNNNNTKNPVSGCLILIVIILLIVFVLGKGCNREDKEKYKSNINIPHRENMYGISDKDIDNINGKIIVENVRNDVTGKWRLVRIADNINIEEYALSYYNKYFESDDEIHAIINFNYNTTTKLSVLGDKLNVETHEYVDKEEHDANILFSGMLYDVLHIYIDNGEVEKMMEK